MATITHPYSSREAVQEPHSDVIPSGITTFFVVMKRGISYLLSLLGGNEIPRFHSE